MYNNAPDTRNQCRKNSNVVLPEGPSSFQKIVGETSHSRACFTAEGAADEKHIKVGPTLEKIADVALNESKISEVG